MSLPSSLIHLFINLLISTFYKNLCISFHARHHASFEEYNLLIKEKSKFFDLTVLIN